MNYHCYFNTSLEAADNDNTVKIINLSNFQEVPIYKLPQSNFKDISIKMHENTLIGKGRKNWQLRKAKDQMTQRHPQQSHIEWIQGIHMKSVLIAFEEGKQHGMRPSRHHHIFGARVGKSNGMCFTK